MSVSDTEYNNFEWDVNIDGLMENNVKVICKKKKKMLTHTVFKFTLSQVERRVFYGEL